MIQDFIKKNWIYLAILLGFIAIASFYFSPAIQGYSLRQGDTSSWKSAAKELQDYRAIYNDEAIWTNSMFSGMPGFITNVEYPNGFTHMDKIISLGLPFPIDVMFIAMLCFFILGKSLKLETKIAIIGSIAYAFVTYNILIAEAGHNTKFRAIAYIPAILGAFIMIYRNKKVVFPTFLLAFFMGLEIKAGHIQMTYYLGFVLIFIGLFELYKYFKDKKIKTFFLRTGLIILAFIFSLLANFTANYYTYTYAKHTMRGTPDITVNPKGAIDNNINQTSGLDRDYIVQWCYGVGETYNLLVPNAKSGSRNATSDFFDYLRGEKPNLFNYSVEQYQKNQGRVFKSYWGNQPFTSGPNYIGAIMVFLALLYLIFVNSTLKWSLLGASVLALLLSWGKNLGGSIESMWLTNFFIDYVPLYSKFRTVASILIVLNLTIPLMAVLFLNHLYKNKEWAKTNIKKLGIASGTIAAIILLFTFMPGVFDFMSENEKSLFDQMYQTYTQTPQSINPIDVEDELINFRVSIFKSDSYRTLILILIAIALLYFWIKEKLSYQTTILLLATVVLFDFWTVNKRYLNNEKNPQNKREYLSWEKKDGYENTNFAGAGDKQIYAIENSLNPKIEQEAIERIQQLKKEKRRASQKDEESIRFASLNFNTNYRVLNLDNPFNSADIAYFHKSSGGYSAAKMGRYQDMIDFYIAKELQFLREPEKMKVLNMLNTKYYLYQGNLGFQNPHVYGNAWFVNDVKLVNDANEEILAIEHTDLKTTAIIDKKFEKQVNGKLFTTTSQDQITLTSYLPNKLVYATKSNTEQLAVFSEIYYEDGWNAYIDDVKTPHLRANYILRGLTIPAGNHTIVFKFEPKMYTIGNIIAIAAFIIIILGLLFSIYLTFFKKENTTIPTIES